MYFAPQAERSVGTRFEGESMILDPLPATRVIVQHQSPFLRRAYHWERNFGLVMTMSNENDERSKSAVEARLTNQVSRNICFPWHLITWCYSLETLDELDGLRRRSFCRARRCANQRSRFYT